jgi:formylglycine-generating enzyme required for sulfatase activity
VQPIEAGEQIDEFRLVRAVGERAFLAHDRLLDRPVIVHFKADGPTTALARVSHPHLVRVHRVREGPRPYVVLEVPRGTPLDELPTPLAAAEVLELGRALASALAALHRAGLVHGDLRAHHVVLGEGGPQLVGLDHARVDGDPAARRADLRALLGLLAEQGLAGPGLTDIASAEELTRELELRRRGPSGGLADNPYRGLRAYGSEDQAIFFGRQAEQGELLGRLRTEPWLIVAGRSGVGKSSLVRAGLAPAIAAGALGEPARWRVVTVAPGAAPLTALIAALAPLFAYPADKLEEAARQTPELISRLARARRGEALCLVIDPLDDVLAGCPPAERDAFLEVLARFSALSANVRVLMTLRSDRLASLADLGVTGRDLVRATALCRPMSADGLREAIVAPARGQGFRFETADMVEDLIHDALGRESALPLLSFALAELWRGRDLERRLITVDSLARMGGLGAAVARHANLVLLAMSPPERRAARPLLVTLATRGRCPRAALLAEGGVAAAGALDALIAARLVVAADELEVAHQALTTAWPRLRAWLDEASAVRAALNRVESATRDWERLGKPDSALLSPRQLAELPRTAAGELVERSRTAARRRRRRRLGLMVGVPLALGLAALAAFLVITRADEAEARALVSARLAEAARARAQADALEAAAQATRGAAFARYDTDDLQGGDARWSEARARGAAELAQLAAASEAIDRARARAPASPEARAAAAEVLGRWLQVARREGADPALEAELGARLAQVDGGAHDLELRRAARLTVRTDPPADRLLLHAVRRGDRYLEQPGRPIAAGDPLALEPGSYVVEASAAGRTPTRAPLLLGPGEERALAIDLPAAAAVPAGYVYVPAGVTLFGDASSDAKRRSLGAQPEHAVWVGAFLIGRTPVTWADYLRFLAALPPAERVTRAPRVADLELLFEPAGPALRWRGATARVGEPVCAQGDGPPACRDWARLPVTGVRWEDAQSYLAWLGASLSGARLCREREWERAARGADGRRYPGGDALPAHDAGARDEGHIIEEEVGAHPEDQSPFGVLDLVGNVGELTGDTIDGAFPNLHVARGGHRDEEAALAVAAHRAVVVHDRARLVGFRVCAPAPP